MPTARMAIAPSGWPRCDRSAHVELPPSVNHGISRRPAALIRKLLPIPKIPMLIMPSTMFGYFCSVYASQV